MKKISVVIPVYNEIENVERIVDSVRKILCENLLCYDYEVLIIDNYSTDGTKDKINEICSLDSKVKAIFNAKTLEL